MGGKGLRELIMTFTNKKLSRNLFDGAVVQSRPVLRPEQRIRLKVQS
jgi:hypothetical protein